MFLSLIRSRRFGPLFWCQFLSSFNDNFVRNMLAMLILFRLGAVHAGAYVTLAVGIFILPSILLSALGGELADSHDKARIARGLKLAEIGVQMIAAAGFALDSLVVLYVALFGLGVLSALFGPIKYGILPDHLAKTELNAGNALIEGATFLAILFGLTAGGLTISEGRSVWAVVAQLMAIAFACWFSSWFIPATRVAAPDLHPSPNLLASTIASLRDLRGEPREWTGGLAVSWFWVTGAVALSLIPVVVKERVGGGVAVETAISSLFAVGVAAGSIAAALVARGRIFLSGAPFAALAMAVFLIDLGFATGGGSAAPPELSLSAFFARAEGLRIALDALGLAFAGGFYVVPIFAAVQSWAGEDRRARVVAAVNILNSIFMVVGSLLASALQALGASEPLLLALLGLANIGAAAISLRAFSPARLAARRREPGEGREGGQVRAQ